MKILPDYLIEYIPYIEEALEELRLSVLDHAYELLKKLDIDELTTDDIRNKLELYDIKVENMTEAWLPNGRFYRMYPSIKHNRTRKNDLISIARSGGQFEGIWSSDFNTKDKYNFKTISLARHYEMSSDLDGYFYISGDTNINADGSVENSAIKALQTDILMASALPAGYTYLYSPWPRPHYPTDSTYFYNVHMLDYDRLAYTEDCGDITASAINRANGWVLDRKTPHGDIYINYKRNHETNRHYNTLTKKYSDILSTDISSYIYDFTTEGDCKADAPFLESISNSRPLSTYYDWYNGSNTSFRTPYWFDYHYMNKLEHTEDSSSKSLSWPIQESGKYYGINNDSEYYEIKNPTNDILYSNAVKYEPDQKELYSQYEYDTSGKRKTFRWSVFPTACYIHSRNRSSEPNRLQKFDLDLDQDGYTYTIDENEYIEPNGDYSDKPGPYRHDLLLKDALIIHENLHHIKKVKSICCEETPFFTTMQSSFNSNLSDDIANNSLKYWMSKKQQENGPQLLSSTGLVIPEYESIVRDNDPPVSIETFTPFCRPTIGKLDPIYVGYTMYGSSQGVDGLGDTQASSTSSTISDNVLYKYGAESADDYIEYDSSLFYTIVSLNEVTGTQPDDLSTGQEHYDESKNPFKAYIIGGPSTGKLYINKNGDTTHGNQHNYATYKTSKIHKLWFSKNKRDILLGSTYSTLYNDQGSSELHYYTQNNIGFEYSIVGIYNDRDELVTDYNNSPIIQCSILGDKYASFIGRVGTITDYDEDIISPVSAAYVLATLKTYAGEVQVAHPLVVYVHNTTTGDYLEAYYIPEHSSISVDGGVTYTQLNEFIALGYVFGAQGNHSLNYEMPSGAGTNEDIDESVAFIDTETIIH